MKANELRISNLVSTEGEILTVKSVSKTVASFEGKDYWILLKDCEPIQLTEDWLIRFGFEKLLPNIEDEIKDELRTVIIFRKIPLTYNTSNGWWMNSSKIKIQLDYVHQLQNLYFALTGTELTIKN